MNKKKSVWIPAIIASLVALLLLAYYFYSLLSDETERRMPANGYGDFFATLGTIAVFLGAASFSWFWFKKKRKSPSLLVRKAGNVLFAMHKFMGWATLILIAVHGTYFLINKLHDDNIFTGLAGFVILLALATYGYFINKIRNKWMRTVHRTLGLVWVPILLLHAGGSAILAVLATASVGGAIIIIENKAKKTDESVQNLR